MSYNWGPYFIVPSEVLKSYSGGVLLREEIDEDLLRKELEELGLIGPVVRVNNPWYYRKKNTDTWLKIGESDDRHENFSVRWDTTNLENGQYEIISARLPDSVGAHCIENHMNYQSIGICLIGNFDYKAPEKEQWDLAVSLVKALCYLLDIPRKNVRGHRDYANYKSCPGNMFDMAKFREELK